MRWKWTFVLAKQVPGVSGALMKRIAIRNAHIEHKVAWNIDRRLTIMHFCPSSDLMLSSNLRCWFRNSLAIFFSLFFLL